VEVILKREMIVKLKYEYIAETAIEKTMNMLQIEVYSLNLHPYILWIYTPIAI